jgi:hypothetical protein
MGQIASGPLMQHGCLRGPQRQFAARQTNF